MANSYRQLISDIRGMGKLLSSEQLINDRVILSEIRSAANMIVTQSLDKRKFWTSPNLFTSLPCLEMEQVPLSECCEYTNPCNIAKSIEEIPKIGEGIYGLAIQAVLSVDSKQKFLETNPNRFANLLKLNMPKLGVYYWIMNNHLYVTNPDIITVSLSAYFTEPVPNHLLYPSGCDCKQPPPLELRCQNPLDQQIKFPENRIYDLKQLTYKNLLSVYHNSPSEENKTSNNNNEATK